MDYETSLIDFLCKKENFEFALEISNYIDKVKQKLHRDFLKNIHECLLEKWPKDVNKDHWEIIFAPHDITAQCEQLFSLRPKMDIDPYLQFGIQQQENFNFVCGVCWNDYVKENEYKEFGIDEIAGLYDLLRNDGYESTNWWVGKKRFKEYGSRDIYLKKIANSENNLKEDAEEIVDCFWDIFETHHTAVQTINESLPTKKENRDSA